MLNHLKRLVDKSLVQVVAIDGAPRYRILQTLAHFGRERLCLIGRGRRDFCALLRLGARARRGCRTRTRVSASQHSIPWS